MLSQTAVGSSSGPDERLGGGLTQDSNKVKLLQADVRCGEWQVKNQSD